MRIRNNIPENYTLERFDLMKKYFTTLKLCKMIHILTRYLRLLEPYLGDHISVDDNVKRSVNTFLKEYEIDFHKWVVDRYENYDNPRGVKIRKFISTFCEDLIVTLERTVKMIRNPKNFYFTDISKMFYFKEDGGYKIEDFKINTMEKPKGLIAWRKE